MTTFNITSGEAGRSLIKFLNRVLVDLPVGRIRKALRDKDIKINGKRIKDAEYILKTGDIIEIYGIDAEILTESHEEARPMFDILFEDHHILVINKPAGISIHDKSNSLDNQVMTYLNFEYTGAFRPASIGRLDKPTSGVIVYAKTYAAIRMLNDSSDKFEKIYEFKSTLAKPGRVELKLITGKGKTRVGREGKVAITDFTIENGRKFASLITGRKHQIRATLAEVGHPIEGDTRYRGPKADRVYLHCTKIKLAGLTDELAYLNNKEFKSKPDWT